MGLRCGPAGDGRAGGGGPPGRPRLAALIYAISLVAMFGFSAAHHRLGLTHRADAVLRRLDHSAIYALIAGTYAPVCLVALPPRWGIPLLAIVAGAAGVGMGIKLVAFGRLNVTSYVMYPALGWVSVVAMPVLVRHLSAAQLAPDPGRRARLHGRDGRPVASVARSAASALRLPRGLAPVHHRGRSLALRGRRLSGPLNLTVEPAPQRRRNPQNANGQQQFRNVQRHAAEASSTNT